MVGLKMYLYSFELESTEDHSRFVWDCEAASWDEAFEILELVYPYVRVRSRERFEVEDK